MGNVCLHAKQKPGSGAVLRSANGYTKQKDEEPQESFELKQLSTQNTTPEREVEFEDTLIETSNLMIRL